MDWTELITQAADNLRALGWAVVGGTIVALVALVLPYRTANLNRKSSELMAAQKLDHDRYLAAQARLFEPRAAVYLEARKILMRLRTTGYGNVFSGDEYAPGWRDEASEDLKTDLSSRIRIYGSSEAADLFEGAWGLLYEATEKEEVVHSLHQEMRREAEGENNIVAKEGIKETRQRIEMQGNSQYGEGSRLLDEFTRVCQRDLEDGKGLLDA